MYGEGQHKMIKYCFIKDEETGTVQLGVGCSDEYYKEIGMKQRDVEQSEVDFLWYLANKCPHYTDEEKLAIAKENKYQEALKGANQFLNKTACFQFDENNSIEATDGNIAKFTAYAVGFSTGQLEQVYWTSKEDNVIVLNAEDVQNILFGLGSIQGDVWNVQFVAYKTAIDEAQTVAEVERIVINYVN